MLQNGETWSAVDESRASGGVDGEHGTHGVGLGFQRAHDSRDLQFRNANRAPDEASRCIMPNGTAAFFVRCDTWLKRWLWMERGSVVVSAVVAGGSPADPALSRQPLNHRFPTLVRISHLLPTAATLPLLLTASSAKDRE